MWMMPWTRGRPFTAWILKASSASTPSPLAEDGVPKSTRRERAEGALRAGMPEGARMEVFF